MAGPQFVFGYGSLAGEGAGRPAFLRGHRRVWGVAMDNSVDIPGYKIYRARADGSRPAVFVAFLDVIASAADCTQGLLLPVAGDALVALDERERNYERVDVTSAIVDAPPGTVWTYRGTHAGRERLRRGVDEGRAVVARAYLESVRSGPASEIEAGDLPVLDLERVDLPAR